MLISSFKLTSGIFLLPLFNFYFFNFYNLELKCTKIHRFVRYTPLKVVKSFIHPVVDARPLDDENSLYGVLAETMILLGNSCYDYQTLDISQKKQ